MNALEYVALRMGIPTENYLYGFCCFQDMHRIFDCSMDGFVCDADLICMCTFPLCGALVCSCYK